MPGATFLHQCHKTGEMMICVMGARAGFGVVLNPKHRLMAMGKGSHGAVIEIEMGDLHSILRQRVGIESEAVVLAGDLHLAGCSAGVIETAMAVIQFERSASESQSQDLMTETNSEQRKLRLIKELTG